LLALFEIELEALNDGEIPPTHGHMVHGLFFRILKQTAPELCDILHDMNGMMPYTLSTLYKFGAHPGILTPDIEKGKRLCYRIGLLDNDLISSVSLAVNKAMIAGPVVIANIPMSIKAIRLLNTEDIENLKKGAGGSAEKLRPFGGKKPSFPGVSSYYIQPLPLVGGCRRA
jgi:CRISPR/Cas system endoribonuclease Cas6 (RAMP superfamily)